MFFWTKDISPSERDTWELRLETEAIPGVALEEDLATPALRLTALCGCQAEADDLARRFGGEIMDVENQDWVALAGESWRGRWLEAGSRMVVALDEDPAFTASLRERFPERHLLVVPPEMAFGTGDHETTATCLELLSDYAAGQAAGWSLLDLGTGTAILAMAGARMGAGRVLGTEVDALALQVAAHNLTRNGLAAEQIELRLEDALSREARNERFDLICANLYAGILEVVIPTLPASLQPDGRILLSGILREQEAGIANALDGAALEVLRRVPRGKWVTLEARRKKSPA